jgi:hypothetical protein
MIEAIHHIRKEIITLLTDAITVDGNYVPVYNKVPQNASEPFIRVYSVDTQEIDENQTSFNIICTSRIDVVTSFLGDTGGELQANQIVSTVLNLIRTRSDNYFDLSANNLNVYTCTVDSVKYLEDVDDDKTFYKGVVTVENRVEKTS